MSKTVTFDKIIFCLFPLCLMLSSLSFVSPGDFLSFLLFPQETGLSQSFETINCCPRGQRKQAINEWPKILPNEKWPNSPSSIAAFYQIIFQIDCKKYLTWQNLVTIHQQLILGSFYIIKSFYIKKLVGWCPNRRSAFYHLDIISIWHDWWGGGPCNHDIWGSPPLLRDDGDPSPLGDPQVQVVVRPQHL